MKRLLAIVLCALLVLGCSSVAFADQVFTVHHIGSMVHPYQKGAETDAHHDGYNPNGPFFHLIAKITTPFLATKC